MEHRCWIERRPSRAKTRKGKPHHRVYWFDPDRKRRSKTFSTLGAAKDFAGRKEAELNDYLRRGLTSLPFSELQRLYTVHLASRSQAYRDDVELTGRYFVELVGDVRTAELSGVPGVRFFDLFKARLLGSRPGHRRRRLSKVAVARHMRNLRKLCSWAIARGYMAGENPASISGVEHVPLRRPEPFTMDDVERLLAHASFYQTGQILVALTTGMRRGDICGLTWDRIDLAAGTITIQQHKTADRKQVRDSVYHVVEPLASWLVEANLRNPGVVFPGGDQFGGIKTRGWRLFCQSAGVAPKMFHRFATTFNSTVQAIGGSAALAAALSNRDPRTVERHYTNVSQHADSLLRRLPFAALLPALQRRLRDPQWGTAAPGT